MSQTTSCSSLTSVLTQGELTETLKALKSQGVSAKAFAAIGKDPNFALEVSFAIHRRTLFTSPEEQIERILEINKEVWNDPAISRKAIQAIGRPPVYPNRSHEGELSCLCLLYETGDPLRTLRRNFQAFAFTFGTSLQQFKSQCFSQSRPAGFHWVVVEFGRKYQKNRWNDSRTMIQAAGHVPIGAEGPLIASLHSQWALAMNGQAIPFLACLDTIFTPLIGPSSVLCLVRDGENVVLRWREECIRVYSPGYLWFSS